MLAGFDVSQWQEPGHYPPGPWAFAGVRMTYADGNDPRAWDHVAALRSMFSGIFVIGYGFGVGTAQAPVTQQANRFLRQANPSGSALDVDILALDQEANWLTRPDGSRYLGPTMNDGEADAFCRQIQQAGRRIGLYHSASRFPSAAAVHFNFRWVANYGPLARLLRRPGGGGAWTFWQWTSSGAIVGDRDWFNGDEAALKLLVANSHV